MIRFFGGRAEGRIKTVCTNYSDETENIFKCTNTLKIHVCPTLCLLMSERGWRVHMVELLDDERAIVARGVWTVGVYLG